MERDGEIRIEKERETHTHTERERHTQRKTDRERETERDIPLTVRQSGEAFELIMPVSGLKLREV